MRPNRYETRAAAPTPLNLAAPPPAVAPVEAAEKTDTEFLLQRLEDLVNSFGHNLGLLDHHIGSLIGHVPAGTSGDKEPEPSNMLARLMQQTDILRRQAQWLEDLRIRAQKI